MEGFRSISFLITNAARSSGRMDDKAPPYLPTGVRRMSRTKADFIAALQAFRLRYYLYFCHQVNSTPTCGKEFKLYFWQLASLVSSEQSFYQFGELRKAAPFIACMHCNMLPSKMASDPLNISLMR